MRILKRKDGRKIKILSDTKLPALLLAGWVDVTLQEKDEPKKEDKHASADPGTK